MKAPKAAIAVFLFLCVAAAPAWALDLGVAGSYWMVNVSGDTQTSILGTNVDLESDLDLDGEGIPSVAAWFGLGKHKLWASYTAGEFEGDSVLSRSITFAGTTFTAATPVHSELSLKMAEALYTYKLLDLENILAGFSVELGAGAKYLDVEGSVASPLVTARDDFAAPIPEVAAAVNVGILADIVSARVQASGIGYDGNSMLEGRAEVSISPIPLFGINGGYRIFAIDAEYDDYTLDTTLSGFYAVVGVSF
ncbi:MAG: hypothetical protein JRI97_09730 [Deltaproteobacteria bacterium]|nr:hypothetical protein [Deltaproteobacteria bacterium]